MRSEPRNARIPVCPLSISLAATLEIDFSFSSSGYLDVSVHRVPPAWLWIHHAVTEVCSARFPHSDISGSMDICSSPKLFAAYHVFHRLLVPRHPPYALSSITNFAHHAGTWLAYTCIALQALAIGIFLIRFIRMYFKLIIINLSYNNYLGCLDIFLIINFLYAVFKVHSRCECMKNDLRGKLACLSTIAFSCIWHVMPWPIKP